MGLAAHKGRGRLIWLVYGALFFPIALVHVVAIRSRQPDDLLSAISAQNVLLKGILDASRTSDGPSKAVSLPNLPPDVVVKPIAVARMTADTFLAKATELGLRTGWQDSCPYRVLSDGEVELFRPDRSIDVFASVAEMERGRVRRTVQPIR